MLEWLAFTIYISVIQPKYENLALRAQEVIGWDWKAKLPKLQIMLGAPRSNRLAEIRRLEYTTTIYVWVRKNQTIMQTAGIIAHELAHAFDLEHMKPEQRKKWLEIRKLKATTEWEPPQSSCPTCSDDAYGSGDFAEAFAFTLVGPLAGFKSTLGPRPNKEQQAFIRELLQIN